MRRMGFVYGNFRKLASERQGLFQGDKLAELHGREEGGCGGFQSRAGGDGQSWSSGE